MKKALSLKNLEEKNAKYCFAMRTYINTELRHIDNAQLMDDIAQAISQIIDNYNEIENES